MNVWIFKDGATKVECTSFPYAFRTMWNSIRKGIESGKRTHNDMIKSMSIISPVKDPYGKHKIYTYNEAKQMAESQGLLSGDEQLNSREFKRK
jgi:hypothetical protein